jgi:predicted ATP-grasp superfamily ATP-dependent carboligase
MVKLTALVTNATDEPGLAAIRSLNRAGFDVVGADFRRLPFGARSRYLRANHVLPQAHQTDLDQHLLNLVRQLQPQVFLPVGSLGVMAASRNLEKFSAVAPLNVPDFDAFLAAWNKTACMAECRRLGIPAPSVYSERDALDLFRGSGQEEPLVVKPNIDVGAAAGVSYVSCPETLRTAVQACREQFGGALIQEYIPGGVEAMRTAVLLFAHDSRLAAAFTTRKIRQWPTTGGLTAASCSTCERLLVDQVLPFFQYWRWRGAAEVELKLDPRDGNFKVIEINPRFPAYLRFISHCGLDMPSLAADLALGRVSVPPTEPMVYTVGAKYLHPGVFLQSVLSDFRSPQSKIQVIRKALGDLRGSASVVLSMLSDPIPLTARMLGGMRNGRPAVCPSPEQSVEQRLTGGNG